MLSHWVFLEGDDHDPAAGLLPLLQAHLLHFLPGPLAADRRLFCAAVDDGAWSKNPIRKRCDPVATAKWYPVSFSFPDQLDLHEGCADADFSECAVDDGSRPVPVYTPCIIPFNFTSDNIEMFDIELERGPSIYPPSQLLGRWFTRTGKRLSAGSRLAS